MSGKKCHNCSERFAAKLVGDAFSIFHAVCPHLNGVIFINAISNGIPAIEKELK
jgi:hypothetical protein